MKTKGKISTFEITLLIFGIVAFAYLVGLEIKPVSAADDFSIEGTLESSGGTPGCCFDTEEGLCSPNSGSKTCEANENGKWIAGEGCDNLLCAKGCCSLGLESQLVTETRCSKLSEMFGVESKFDKSITSELSCIESTQSLEKGACRFKTESEVKYNCKFTTKTECDSVRGEFFNNYLCSNPELETNCERQKTTGCVDEKDEVYWFDSCGNPENIYDSNKARSWNNGKVLSKELSCNPIGDNSLLSTCGNCDYNKGSICGAYRKGVDKKKLNGDYTCRNLNCKDGLKTRKNGESWCVYDGVVGSGRDVVGSRHYRELCVNGEIKTEPCADYRKEICVETSAMGSVVGGLAADIPGVSGLVSSSLPDQSGAFCRTNMWEDCGGRTVLNCAQNPDCMPKVVYVSNDFYFTGCVPKYPPGFELGGIVEGATDQLTGELGGQLSSSGLGALGNLGQSDNPCSKGTKTCTVVYQKKGIAPFCKWECVKNCECEKIIFTAQMNEYCQNLGDCGAKSNIAGKVTEGGYSISKKGGKAKKPPRLTGIDKIYGIFAIAIPGQSAKPGFFNNINGLDNLQMYGIDEIFGNYMGKEIDSGMFSGGQLSNTLGGSAVGATGAGLGVASLGGHALGAGAIASGTVLSGGSTATLGAGSTLTLSNGVTLTGVQGGIGVTSTGLAGVTSVSGSTVTLSSGVTGTVGGAGTTTAAAGGAGAGGASTSGGTLLGLGPTAWVGVGVLAYLGLSYLMGCGETEETEITFTCKQWQRPAVGNCGECNKDEQKPCSKYKCESLGMNCKLINEDTANPECVTVETGEGIPVISPNYEVLNKNKYSYTSVGLNGFNVRTKDGKCLPAFEHVAFGVNTNIPAQCKFSTDPKILFDSMEYSFLEGDLYSKNHTTTTYLPSAESVIAGETLNTDEFNTLISNETVMGGILDILGDVNIYVKCANTKGVTNVANYKINFCVDDGPDRTPPVIIATSPPEDSIVAYNATQWNAGFYVNEPAECRFSDEILAGTSEEQYFAMTNNMYCEDDVGSGSLLGYLCNATLQIKQKENNFYIVCRDQPWLEENNSRNIGSVYEYKLYRSDSALVIDSITPRGTVYSELEPASVELKAETSGGVNGDAYCQYSLSSLGEDIFITFYDTGKSEHNQMLNSMLFRNYTIKVRCIDTGGNTAYNEAKFELVQGTAEGVDSDGDGWTDEEEAENGTDPNDPNDYPEGDNNSDNETNNNLAPEVTRVYSQGGDIIVLTNKNSKCVYSNNALNKCEFAFDNGISMSEELKKIHIAERNDKLTYYIKCKDRFDNQNSECAVIVKHDASV
ncbi:MAG: hypothetical protein WC533_00420 [Candidatus Pacearchaeota archaeon]